jgi:hypothetical protein
MQKSTAIIDCITRSYGDTVSRKDGTVACGNPSRAMEQRTHHISISFHVVASCIIRALMWCNPLIIMICADEKKKRATGRNHRILNDSELTVRYTGASHTRKSMMDRPENENRLWPGSRQPYIGTSTVRIGSKTLAQVEYSTRVSQRSWDWACWRPRSLSRSAQPLGQASRLSRRYRRSPHG